MATIWTHEPARPVASSPAAPARSLAALWAMAADAAVVALVCLLFVFAPHASDFAWSDAPRHALNGVFVKDLVAAMPIHDPAGYAYRYYAQYPGLTILFYPPMFYLVSAPFYALFGVSETTALFVVALHYCLFGWGMLRLFREFTGPLAALSATLALLAAPEIAFWGRQVMLEVPALAWVAWSAWAFTRHRRTGSTVMLGLAIALLVGAMYTKINAAFLGGAYALTLLLETRGAVLKDRRVWIFAGIGALALVPLAVLTLKFGQANVQSVTGVADSVASRHTLAGWLWYAHQLPAQLGWATLGTALVAGVVVIRAALHRRFARVEAGLGWRRGDLAFWLLWFDLGYLFFSAIDLKEARHSVLILPPLVLVATLLLAGIARRLPNALTPVLLAALPVATTAQTLLARPVERVGGYAEAADYVAARAPRDSRVLFSGYRDGSFTFAMRSHEERRDMGVVRADKLLLSVSVRRELGVTEKAVSDAQLLQQLRDLGVSYVVMQPGFWTDLPAMRRFEALLATPAFERVATLDTPANFPAHEHGLAIYRVVGPVHAKAGGMAIDLPIIQRRIETK